MQTRSGPIEDMKEGMNALDALDFVSCIVVRRNFFKDIDSGEIDVWLSLKFETI